MCGILGYVGGSSEQLDKAAKTIAYRGPDFYGHFCDGNICLGHQRLSIIDLDSRSNQPLADTEKTLQIVFNGEIYNYKTLKQELLSKDLNFNTESDTEVILNAYKNHGVECIKNLQGMFAFGIFDIPGQKIILARDHAGIKPLYYYQKDGVFAFASEIKALVSLLKQNGVKLEVDKQSIRQFLILGYIPSPCSLVKDIKKLPKSSFAIYDLKNQSFNIQNFEPFYNKITNLNEYKELIEKKVLDHLIADVPVGVYFSGGTDSSLIAAILHKHNIKLKTFSIDLGNREDKYYFDKINSLLKLDSQVIHFGEDEMQQIYERVSRLIDEPTWDSSIYPTAYISQIAAKDVKVVLSGEGGDEYFWGYHRHLVLERMGFGHRFASKHFFNIFRLLPTGLRRNAYLKLGRILNDAWLYYLSAMSPAIEYLNYDSITQIISNLEGQSTEPVYLDRDFYLENDLLRKIDLATSYASIEGRVPLLDFDIVRNSELFKDEHLKNGELKSFLKKILTDYLPADLVNRKKAGFGLKGDMIEQCPKLKQDAEKGLAYLRATGLLPRLSISELQQKNPGLVYAAASLKSSLQNLGFSLD
ncbi:MAG: asparagine synthase (glutamine-hydrolyzing) [Patescibacteria group bacterium]